LPWVAALIFFPVGDVTLSLEQTAPVRKIIRRTAHSLNENEPTKTRVGPSSSLLHR
jgi:hypothetical protein